MSYVQSARRITFLCFSFPSPSCLCSAGLYRCSSRTAPLRAIDLFWCKGAAKGCLLVSFVFMRGTYTHGMKCCIEK